MLCCLWKILCVNCKNKVNLSNGSDQSTYSINVNVIACARLRFIDTTLILNTWRCLLWLWFLRLVQMWIRHETVVVCEFIVCIHLVMGFVRWLYDDHWLHSLTNSSISSCCSLFRFDVQSVELELQRERVWASKNKNIPNAKHTWNYYWRWVSHKQLQMKPHAFIYVALRCQCSNLSCVYRLVIWYWAHQHNNTNIWHSSWCSLSAVLNRTVLCVCVCVCVKNTHQCKLKTDRTMRRKTQNYSFIENESTRPIQPLEIDATWIFQ